MNMDPELLTLAIQAGGGSTRMGRDKALLPFLGQPLILRLLDRLQPLASQVLITTNDPAPYAFLGLPLFPDLVPGCGALGGLYTALSAASRPLVAVVACDMPFASPAILAEAARRMVAEEVDVVIPRPPAGLEPLHAVYRRQACLPHVQAALHAGQRKVISWFDSVRLAVMSPRELARLDPSGQAFLNINTPADLAAAEQFAAEQLAARGQAGITASSPGSP